MSLKPSSGKLNRSAKSFRDAWQQARIYWRDQRAQAFEEKYVMWLESCVRTALGGMDHMDRMITEARRDCE
ncbi:MAG: hypothetical protein WBF17_18370 [Phycisphaerae bacterium]